MAIYRTIQMSFWTDTKVVDCFTPEDKYFYLYLMTNPHTNLSGCYEVSIKQVSDETGYTKETVERLIERMEKVHNVIRYSKTSKELLILNWSKYNWTTSPTFQKPLRREIGEVKDDEFRSFLNDVADGIDTVSIPYTYPIDTTVTVTDIDNKDFNSNDNTDTKNNKKNKKNTKDIVKHRYGEYSHVLLSDKEYERLSTEYGEDATKQAIQKVDEYCQESGKRYSDYNLTIRRWGFKGIKTKKTESKQSSLDEWAAKMKKERGET